MRTGGQPLAGLRRVGRVLLDPRRVGRVLLDPAEKPRRVGRVLLDPPEKPGPQDRAYFQVQTIQVLGYSRGLPVPPP